MKPNDTNGNLPPDKRSFRVLIISGSQRRIYNCPGVDSKSRALMLRMADRLPQDWEIDLEDLSNVYGRHQIQSCNACVSTSMALCVWPCNCYEKGSKKEPDLMWDLDLYARLDLADAWVIIGPVNWYGLTSNLKKMFDRLVCMNGGNPDEKLIDHKDPEKAMTLEKSPQWKELSLNHMEGRTAAFFCHGDEGGDEVAEDGRPKLLRHKEYFDPSQEPFENIRDAYRPLVWQCRYSGIEVPDDLWEYATFGKGKKYSDNQAEDMVQEKAMEAFDAWADRFAAFVAKKGKVQPGKHRAFGYKPPPHRLADLKLKWRQIKIVLDINMQGSSVKKQEELGLSRDRTFSPDKSTAKQQYKN